LLNRRRTPRFSTGIQARLTLLEEPVITLAARIQNISEGGLQVVIDRSSRLGASLRLEVEDVALYGQIRYCCPWLGGYIIGVCVELILIGGNELTCSVPDLLEYWAANTDLQANTSA
jgi:hypothetical protein